MSESPQTKVNNFGYALDYNWDHPWPRAPIPSNEGGRLNELMKYRILDTPKDSKFNKLCRLACQEMKCPISAISFIDKDRQWFKANSGLTQASIPRDVSFCAHAIMNPHKPIVVPDTSLDPRFKNNPLVSRASMVKFYASVPITTRNGFAIGSVFVFDIKVHDNFNVKMLRKIAAKVMKYLDEAKAEANGDVPTASESRSTPPAPVQNSQTNSSSEPKKLAPVKKAPPQVVKPTKPVEPQTEPVPESQAPTLRSAPLPTTSSSALVPANQTSSTTLATQESSSAVVGSDSGSNMGAMLMNLLARTTETQQQLAAQQGVMFETLGSHGDKLSSLRERLNHMEDLIDRKNLEKTQKSV